MARQGFLMRSRYNGLPLSGKKVKEHREKRATTQKRIERKFRGEERSGGERTIWKHHAAIQLSKSREKFGNRERSLRGGDGLYYCPADGEQNSNVARLKTGSLELPSSKGDTEGANKYWSAFSGEKSGWGEEAVW